MIDTTSPGGRMMMQMVETFAEFEHAMLRERPQKMVMMRHRSKAVSVVADQKSKNISNSEHTIKEGVNNFV